MKLKNKILLSLFLTVGILFIWNLTAEAKTYDNSKYTIWLPNSYQNTQNTEDSIQEEKDITTIFRLEVTQKQGTDLIVSENYMNYLISIFQQSYGSDFTLISKNITKKSECIGLELQFRETSTGITHYFSVYQFLSDNYSYLLLFGSTNKSYINSVEKNEIVKSFKIKDTVTSSNGIPFTDVSKNSWYYDTVKYTYENNLISGANEYEFRPDAKITRGMIVTILWRMEGKPKVTGIKDFTDVTGQYYYNAVRWAAKNKIVSGYNSGKFGPNDNITREQLATILCNYAKYKKQNVNLSTDTSKYKDWYKVTGYARPAMSWAVSKGVITGKYNGTKVDPQGTASRAEAAGMIYNYCTKIK